MMSGAVLILSLVGFSVLMLAMTRHHQDWRGRKPTLRAQRLLRVVGAFLLASGLSLAVLTDGWGHGVVEWLGGLSAAVALVIMANLNRDQLLRWFRMKQP